VRTTQTGKGLPNEEHAVEILSIRHLIVISTYKNYQNPYPQMHFSSPNFTKIRFPPELRPDPAEGAYDAPQSAGEGVSPPQPTAERREHLSLPMMGKN